MTGESSANSRPLPIGGRSQTPPNQFNSLNTSSRTERRDDFWSPEAEAGSSSHHKSDMGLLPAFSSSQYTHLPTPQSPSDGNRLGNTVHQTPESPLPQSSQSFNAAPGSLSQRFSQRSFVDEGNARTPSQNHQVLTPDSSPYVSKVASSRQSNFATPTYYTPSRPFPSPSRMSLEASILNTAPTLNTMFQPSASSPETPPPPSTLSSPFMAKLSGSDRSKRREDSSFPPIPSIPTVDFFSSGSTVPPEASSASAGGELERIRSASREDQIALEARRPEYLRRTRRAGESDSNAMAEDERTIGIMETPMKGRRLKLFQETSEESFEESLMAGGYGRYRTADWVRQPQPLTYPGSGLTGTSSIVQQLETVEEQPPTEKELKKRKRLDAFRSSRSEGSSRNKLYPVELEGKGRVLLDIPNELPLVPGSPGPSPTKKRASRRKKKVTDSPSKDKRTLVEQGPSLGPDEHVNKPNWPDSEFPWKLRTEEREEAEKAEEQERLKWIEKFLDSESEDEDDELTPVETESTAYTVERLPPLRPGRGKMVPLLAHPEDPRKASQNKRMSFPSDPGDALSALLSKRSVRALSYRQQRRQRELDDHEEAAELCICRGTDDGRELVQCDGCQTWYHLDCIGIRDISELGREEDPWFCRRCLTRSPSPSYDPEGMMDVPTSEPTFAPTDEAPQERSSDATLYQSPSLHDSPNWLPPRMPKTPTRGSHHQHVPAWPDFSSKHAPTTPKDQNYPVKIYAHHTPGSFDGYRHIPDESPFDPTSTPSRGIRFSGPFSTPKTNPWTRPVLPMFHTPSRPGHKVANRSFGGAGSLSATLDSDVGKCVEDSPGARGRNQLANGMNTTRRGLGSLEDSPVMRTNKGKESERRVCT